MRSRHRGSGATFTSPGDATEEMAFSDLESTSDNIALAQRLIQSWVQKTPNGAPWLLHVRPCQGASPIC